jgi:hypothetical protein
MTRDYAAIIAALRAKAKATEFDAERDALNAKADELAKEHNITEDKPSPLNIDDDWVQQYYRMSRDDFIRDFFGAPIFRAPGQFVIVITGEDQRWRRSYLWPPDGSPLPNPDHSWEDTELWGRAANAGNAGVI